MIYVTILQSKSKEALYTVIFPENISLKSVIGNEFEFKKSESVYVPGRTFHGLTYRVSGKINIIPSGSDKKLISDKGCITYVPKGCPYNTEILEDGRMLILHFEALQEYKELSVFVSRPTYPIAFENMFRSFLDRYRSTGGICDYACLSMVYEIFANIVHEISSGQKQAVPRRMRDIKSFIDENYADREITVPALSKMCGVSEVYFRREFRECFSASPIEYIKRVRLENAKSLLSTGIYQVSEIATRCGFDSISYFSYEFKRKCGESPLEYAKRFEEKHRSQK